MSNDISYILPEPPFVRGGQWIFDPTCWAAALSSWQAVTVGRQQETVDEIYDRLPNVLMDTPRKGKKTLDSARFHDLCIASNVEIAWRPFSGSEFTSWNLELFLSVYQYAYVVTRPLNAEHGSFSHARVMFGASDKFKTALFLDPASNRVAWGYSEMKQFKFLVGVAREYIDSLAGDGWSNEKPR